MGKLNGTSMLVIVDGVAIGGTKSFTLDISVDLPDATTKDSDGWAENIHGLRSWSVSFDGLYDPALTYNGEEIFDELDNRDEVYLEMAVIDGTGGGLVLKGNAKVASLSFGGEHEQPVTLSGSFTGSGDLNKGTIATS
jgi:predicted secreted protein